MWNKNSPISLLIQLEKKKLSTRLGGEKNSVLDLWLLHATNKR